MPEQSDTDISLRDLVLRLRFYFVYLKGKWKVILSCGALFGILFLVLNLGAPRIFTAHLSFMLNVDERGMTAGLAALAGQFGLGMLSNESNLDKVLELSRSRKISEIALFDSVTIDRKKDFLGNHIISVLERYDRWDDPGIFSFSKDSIPLDGFRFESADIENFGLRENKALKNLHEHLTGSEEHDAMFHSGYNELTGIMRLELSSPEEALSIKSANALFNALSTFYVLKSTEKQKYEYEILLDKYDSLYITLNQVKFELAKFEDTNRNLFRKQDLLRREKLQIEEQKLILIIAKAEEQLQLAKIALDNKTPYIQLIDKPISPIKPDNKPLAFHVFTGFALGILFSSLFYFVYKCYYELLQ